MTLRTEIQITSTRLSSRNIGKFFSEKYFRFILGEKEKVGGISYRIRDHILNTSVFELFNVLVSLREKCLRVQSGSEQSDCKTSNCTLFHKHVSDSASKRMNAAEPTSKSSNVEQINKQCERASK